MKNLKRQTATGRTTERIRELIISGEIGAGETLRQEELSVRLGVSRTPLREAMIILQSEGLVINHPHKGTVVYKPTVAELQEIYATRLLLEPAAARLATRNMTPAVLAEVDSIVHEMTATTTPWQLIRLNHEFRYAFYSASGNRTLADTIRGLTLRAEPYVGILVSGLNRPFTDQAFAALLEAIRRGDGDRAAAVTQAHLEATVANVLPMLQR